MKIEQEIQIRRIVDLRNRLDVAEQKNIDSMLGVYDKAITDLKQSISKTRSLNTKAQQKNLLAQLKKAHKTIAATLTSILKKDTREVAGDAFDGMKDILSWDGKDADFNSTIGRTNGLLDTIDTVPIGGALLTDWVQKNFDNTLDVQKNVLASRLKGESYRKMYQSLVKDYPDKTRNELITLARTYNQSAVITSQEKLFEENRDVMKSVRWSAVMELGYSHSGRGTCPRCAALDGNEYKLDEKKPDIPLHARCRCMWEPITLSWSELLGKERLRDENGNPIERDEMKKTYRKWYNREEANIDVGRQGGNITSVEWAGESYGDFITAKGGKSLVNAVGQKRAALIEAGELKFSDLVDPKTGKLYTLEEMGFGVNGKGWILPIETKEKVVSSTNKEVFLPSIKTQGKKKVSAEYINKHKALVLALPEKAKKAVDDYGATFLTGNDMIDIYPNLKGVHPRGWGSATWASVEACYSPSKKEIVVTKQVRRGKKIVDVGEARFAYALKHETGHALDRALGGGNVISERPEVVAMYKKAVKGKTKAKNPHIGYFLQKGVAGPSETVAEAFAVVMGHSDEFSKEFEETFKEIIDYVKELL